MLKINGANTFFKGYVGGIKKIEKDNYLQIKNTKPDTIRFTATAAGPKIGLSESELTERTNPECLMPKIMLDIDNPEFLNLEEGDKKALKHLVKAAMLIDEVSYKLDNHQNIAFKKYLMSTSKKGDESAQKALKIFKAQRGIFAVDLEGNKIALMKNATSSKGNGYFPKDLSSEELNDVVQKMIKEKKKKELAQLLNQRTVVKRIGKKLVAIDYTKEFEKEFKAVAKELEKAANVSTNKDFNEYLRLQARALRVNDPKSDAKADIKWATLQDTPLEFTIVRENYADKMTGSLSKETEKMLKDAEISYYKKDELGARVGIVNPAGTEDLLDITKYLPKMAEAMPYADKYEQSISKNAKDEIKQTMVDVDIVCVTGHAAACRGGLLRAENLPNNDKLAIEMGGGKRNVYHRQARMSVDPHFVQKKLDAMLAPQQHKYYNQWALHQFTIAHENLHSLGPITNKTLLGDYGNIIEENKADIGAIALLDVLVEEGKYSNEEKKQIITSSILEMFRKAMPDKANAHRAKEIMQLNYLFKKDAIRVNEEGLLEVNFDKTVKAAKAMLSEIIKVQLSEDKSTAKKYFDKNFEWTNEIEEISSRLRMVDHILNFEIQQPLAEMLLEQE